MAAAGDPGAHHETEAIEATDRQQPRGIVGLVFKILGPVLLLALLWGLVELASLLAGLF